MSDHPLLRKLPEHLGRLAITPAGLSASSISGCLHSAIEELDGARAIWPAAEMSLSRLDAALARVAEADTLAKEVRSELTEAAVRIELVRGLIAEEYRRAD